MHSNMRGGEEIQTPTQRTEWENQTACQNAEIKTVHITENWKSKPKQGAFDKREWLIKVSYDFMLLGKMWNPKKCLK